MTSSPSQNSPRVKSIHEDPEAGDVYVGRPSKWGNPFHIGVHGSREEVISKHREFVESNPKLVADIKRELRGLNLVCHCVPNFACHGETLLEIANE